MQNFRISWNEGVVRPYSSGVDRGMFYIPDEAGIPWNGLQEVVESSPDSVMTQLFQDGQRLIVRRRDLNYEAKLKAYTYPHEFEPYAGYSKSFKRPFGFSYRVMTGPETYQIHLVYNVVAMPDDVVFSTLGDEIDPTFFSWTLASRPVKIAGRVPSSHLILDSETVHSWTMTAIEDQLYGGEGIIPNLPTPDEIVQIFEDNALFKVTLLGNGLVQVDGPEEAIQQLGNGLVRLDWPSVEAIDRDSWRVSSY